MILLGLFTLIFLEIVLGVDNIIVISILIERFPVQLQEKIRIIGLTCAFFMRIILLFFFTFLVSCKVLALKVFGHSFSIRDIAMLAGGLFLVLKSIIELYKRSKKNNEGLAFNKKKYKVFNVIFVIVQIVFLDVIFSFDSIIASIGIVENVNLIILSIFISFFLMILASKFFFICVNSYPNIVILCLWFLFLVGFNYFIQGFGFLIHKEFIYISVVFLIFIGFLKNFLFFQRKF